MELHFKNGEISMVDGASVSLQPAMEYRREVMELTNKKATFADLAKKYQTVDFSQNTLPKPRSHQIEAVQSWLQNKGEGILEMPTGAGKTMTALYVVHKIGRTTLIVVPTIDLMHQWSKQIKGYFGIEPGLWGDGNKTTASITISTYDSAAVFTREKGDQFGLLIFDECHHLSGKVNGSIAKQCIAPFRLGLSATVATSEKADHIYELVGDIVYSAKLKDLEEKTIAAYETKVLEISLTEDERKDYENQRRIYTSWLRRNNIILNSKEAWQTFMQKSMYMPGGRQAMNAFRAQKAMSHTPRGKFDAIWNIMQKHAGEKMIVFTHQNSFAYAIAREFCLPVISHKTGAFQRKETLRKFKEGEIDIVVTSKVLNEGVDVPSASIGIIASGTSSVREHVQRIGRILRHKEGKNAYLYELVSKDTREESASKRRRKHDVYRRKR
jgi:superfamily II DNA or RNA helicase